MMNLCLLGKKKSKFLEYYISTQKILTFNFLGQIDF